MTPLSQFMVDCFMFTYNEVDIIEAAVKHIGGQGLRLHILDNWSTDGTWEVLNNLPLASLGRFPSDGPSEFFLCADMLRRFELLSSKSDADWVMIQDADEIRRSRRSETLREGFWRIENEGYNAVDFDVVWFHPVDDGFNRGMNPEEYFRMYVPHHIHSDSDHIKAWKNQRDKHVSIVDSGSHFTTFDGIRVHPESFLLKHYPVRGQTHGERKILRDRIPRYLPDEISQFGWHVQYLEALASGYSFLALPEPLLEWTGA